MQAKPALIEVGTHLRYEIASAHMSCERRQPTVAITVSSPPQMCESLGVEHCFCRHYVAPTKATQLHSIAQQ